MIFCIKTLSETFSVVLYMDGKNITPDEIEKLLRQAAKVSNQEIDEHTLSVEVMYVIFADFDHLLGVELGYELESDGFAMDWANGLPRYRQFAMKIQEVVVRFISAASEEFKKQKGYSFTDVFIKAAEEGAHPDVAQAQIERQINKATFH